MLGNKVGEFDDLLRSRADACLMRTVRCSVCGEEPCVAVSACLLGKECRFDATSRRSNAVCLLVSFLKSSGCRIVLVCPECMGGLRRPRPPAEIQPDGRVLDRNGLDLTQAFVCGAEKTLLSVEKNRVALAVLKAKSPSCGRYEVFDGTFSGTTVPGMGVAASRLVRGGVPVVDEIDVARFVDRHGADGTFATDGDFTVS